MVYTQKRHLKSQVSSKLKTYCTTSIVVKVKYDKFHDKYWPTHYGHRTLLGHLRIPQKDRVAIAGKLFQGVIFECILDDIRNTMDTSINRTHLITRKGIANI